MNYEGIGVPDDLIELAKKYIVEREIKLLFIFIYFKNTYLHM